MEHSFFFFFFLKGAKAQVVCSQPLTLGSGEGKAAQTGGTPEESGVGSTGERHVGVAVGIFVGDIR